MNEPHYLTIPEGKICDFINGNFRNDTPEEYVCQNLEKRLVNELKYPRERIGVEITLQLGSALGFVPHPNLPGCRALGKNCTH
jgi:type I restriction enzyme M protein